MNYKVKKFESYVDNDENYMEKANLHTIQRLASELLALLENHPNRIDGWASEHIATSKDDIEEVFNFMKSLNESITTKKSQKQMKTFTLDGDLYECLFKEHEINGKETKVRKCTKNGTTITLEEFEKAFKKFKNN